MKRRSKRRNGGVRGGFSLIEVALAIMVAAGGLVSAFTLFPVSLRQSAESRSDLIESTFAATVLETIAGNVRQIDDVATWNDPDEWWKTAVGSSFESTPSVYATPKEFQDGFDGGSQSVKGFSLPTTQVAEFYGSKKNPLHEIRYYGRERTSPPGKAGRDKIQEPAQWLLRLNVLGRPVEGDAPGDAMIPKRYLVTIVSTPVPKPEMYTHHSSFSQEYFFVHRP